MSTGDPGVDESLVLHSRRVVTSQGCMPATVLATGERIAEIVPGPECPAEAEDFGDWVISPGSIDSHVHCNEPGHEDWEGFATATAAAAAGGVTTLIDMPLNSLPVTTDVAALELKKARARTEAHVDVGFYGGLTPQSRNDLETLARSGVLGIKVFLCPSGLDEFGHVGRDDLLAGLEVLESLGLPLLAHAEIVSDKRTSQPPHSPDTYETWLASRPPELEVRAIELLGECSRQTGAHVHIVHVASSEALSTFESERRLGARLTAETCPHYLYFCSEEVPEVDTRFKCAPPIRSTSHRDALRNAVERGSIATIGSDHSPCPRGLKNLPLSQAWGGISGVQWTLPVVWTALRERGATCEALARWLAGNPATLFGLDRKGAIAPGMDADLVVWDPDAGFEVTTNEMLDRHKLSPYAGEKLHGLVHRTYLRGQLVFCDGQLTRERAGCLIER